MNGPYKYSVLRTCPRPRILVVVSQFRDGEPSARNERKRKKKRNANCRERGRVEMWRCSAQRTRNGTGPSADGTGTVGRQGSRGPRGTIKPLIGSARYYAYLVPRRVFGFSFFSPCSIWGQTDRWGDGVIHTSRNPGIFAGCQEGGPVGGKQGKAVLESGPTGRKNRDTILEGGLRR